MIPAAVSAQSLSRAPRADIVVPEKCCDAGAEALAALRRLGERVIVYRSQQEFEADGRLAYVTLQTFEHDLSTVNAQLVPILEEMPEGKAKTEIINGLASYRDGLHWWRKVDRPRVVHVSMLRPEQNLSPADAALMSTAGYTVAIHWRQAARYLQKAEALIEEGVR